MKDISLEQLFSMSPEEFRENFPNESSRWRRIYPVSAEKLIRAIVLAAKKVDWTKEIEEGEQRGVREFWYNPVKPILLKAIGERAHKYLFYTEKILSRMVKEGQLTYLDLGVRDYRTLREIYEAIDQAKCWRAVLLFVEKDSAYVHLVKKLVRLFNINVISGGGWSNTAGIERLLRNLVERGIKEVTVFTLTDYDPFGFAIDTEFIHKCEVLGLSVSSHIRIGIHPEHATPKILDVQKYPIKPGRKLTVEGISFNADEWLEEYGIEGKFGLEIEAISGQPGGPQRLREIVASELLQHLREEDRLSEIRGPLWERAPETAINTLLGELPRPEYDSEKIPPPEEYLTEEEYKARKKEIEEEKEIASNGVWSKIVAINKEIERLTEPLEREKEKLHEKVEEIEEPYEEELEELEEDFRRSRAKLRRALMKWFKQNQDRWKKENFDMGLPTGCLLKAVKEGNSIDSFIARATDKVLIRDIIKAMKDALEKGEIEVGL